MLSNMSNKIAVVGCGAAVEKLYVPHLQQKLRDKVSLIFVDQDINRAKLYAKKFSGSYASSITMAYKNGAEGAIIATPHPSHLELAKEALQFPKIPEGDRNRIETNLKHSEDAITKQQQAK